MAVLSFVMAHLVPSPVICLGHVHLILFSRLKCCKIPAMGWKNLSHMDFHIAEAHPCVMNSAERNPKIGGVCSRTCLAVQQLEVIFTLGSHHDAEGAMELSKAGGAFYRISALPVTAVTAHCLEITSYLLQFSQAFHFSAEFLPGTDFGCCSVLLNSCYVPHLSGPPSILEKTLNP